jgi:hypothetical protein
MLIDPHNACMTPCSIRSLRFAILVLATLGSETGAAWTVNIAQDPLTRQEQCMVRSESQTIQDGYGETPVALMFDGQALLVVTESHIDTSFADLALVVDGKAPFHTTKLARQTVIVFDNDIATLIEQLKKGSWVTAYLRFWPTWPPTQRIAARFTLKGFTKAYSEFERCHEQSRAAGGS